MKTRTLKNQLIFTVNQDGRQSRFRRDVTIWEWEADPKKREAECLLHGGIATLLDTSQGWKVKRISY